MFPKTPNANLLRKNQGHKMYNIKTTYSKICAKHNKIKYSTNGKFRRRLQQILGNKRKTVKKEYDISTNRDEDQKKPIANECEEN